MHQRDKLLKRESWKVLPIPDYRAPLVFRGGHGATLGTHFFKKSSVKYTEGLRLDTSDGDFFYADMVTGNNGGIVVLLHGLEGNSQRPYIMGMAQVAIGRGWGVAAMNFRSCNGQMNSRARFYHSGDTGDVEVLINHLTEKMGFKRVVLVGFSLGGNVALKYLGEKGNSVQPEIEFAMAISVPVDLSGSSDQIESLQNRLYLRRFLKSLKGKVRQKMNIHPGEIDWKKGLIARTFREFDEFITAPLHGFEDAADYYRRSSSLFYLDRIAVPSLLLSAKNDSFLSNSCYPTVRDNSMLRTIFPKHGGHVGFPHWPVSKQTYPELILSHLLSRADDRDFTN
ncbi:MAG: alpha/beta fold hydrolase [Saprospirales bacterium]|nr:MAG: alpha/beta fold hydrolase [Saprospirales bacterium]